MLAEAHDLWRGSPLSDLSTDSVICREAERLWEQFRDNLEELADVSLVLGRHLEWIPTLELMVIDAPLRERRWELLMVGLHGCGRQAEALRAFQRARVRAGGGGTAARIRAVRSREARLLERQIPAVSTLSYCVRIGDLEMTSDRRPTRCGAPGETCGGRLA